MATLEEALRLFETASHKDVRDLASCVISLFQELKHLQRDLELRSHALRTEKNIPAASAQKTFPMMQAVGMIGLVDRNEPRLARFTLICPTLDSSGYAILNCEIHAGDFSDASPQISFIMDKLRSRQCVRIEGALIDGGIENTITVVRVSNIKISSVHSENFDLGVLDGARGSERHFRQAFNLFFDGDFSFRNSGSEFAPDDWHDAFGWLQFRMEQIVNDIAKLASSQDVEL